MIDPDLLMLLLLCVVILLPIVPAYLLFRALDSSAIVSGPLKGFNLKLGGAFAGYFATVLITLTAYAMVRPRNLYELWELNGRVTDTDGKPIQPLQVEDLILDPGWLDAHDAGTFHMFFFPRPGLVAGRKDFPNVIVRHNGYTDASFSLDPKQTGRPGAPTIHWDASNRSIHIDGLALSRLPPYDPQGPAITLGPATEVGRLVTSERANR